MRDNRIALSAEALFDRMNQMAAQSKPFVFGVDFELQHAFFIENPMEDSFFLWRIGEKGNVRVAELREADREAKGQLRRDPVSYEAYFRGFEVIHSALMRGDSFLANYTLATPIQMEHTLREVFDLSRSPYVCCWPDHFVCFSPEPFVKISSEGRISSYPMKGTIRADLPNAEERILSDYKESAEHFTIVDLIRSDLSRVASEVKVDRLRYIDRLSTSSGEILQVSSEISGQMPADWKARLGDLMRELLPAGSVSGAPKRATCEAIRQAESGSRGFYCGVWGYFDGDSLDSAVMIRFIEQRDGKLFFRSGGGITINSDPRAEYEEVITKVYLPF